MPYTTRLRTGAGRRKNYRTMAGRRAPPLIQRTIGGRKVINTKAVRAIAKQVVHKESENKFVSTSFNQLFNSTIASASECYPLMPQIPEGTGDYQRVGDKVRGRGLYIKGFVQIGKDVAGNIYNIPPSTLRCMILSQKNIKVSSAVQTQADVAHLLKDNYGTGTARDYAGGQLDNLAPINKDLFHVYMDKKIRFQWQNIQTGTGGAPTVEWQSGNNITRYFSCKIKVPATLTFDDGNGDYVNNFAPFFCMGSVCDDGDTPFTLTTPWKVVVQSVLYYEDS